MSKKDFESLIDELSDAAISAEAKIPTDNISKKDEIVHSNSKTHYFLGTVFAVFLALALLYTLEELRLANEKIHNLENLPHKEAHFSKPIQKISQVIDRTDHIPPSATQKLKFSLKKEEHIEEPYDDNSIDYRDNLVSEPKDEPIYTKVTTNATFRIEYEKVCISETSDSSESFKDFLKYYFSAVFLTNSKPVIQTLSTHEALKQFENGTCAFLIADNETLLKFELPSFTLSAFGGVRDLKQTNSILKTLVNPKARKILKNDNYQMIGFFVRGFNQFILTMPQHNLFTTLEKKSIGYLGSNPLMLNWLKELGSHPLKLNNQKSVDSDEIRIDSLVTNTLNFSNIEPEENEKHVALDHLISLSMLQVVTHTDRFSSDFISLSMRESYNFYVDSIRNRTEKSVIKNYALTETERERIEKISRRFRKKQKKAGVYDPKLLKLLWKIRCSATPYKTECAIPE